jgi:CBS domain-containing protein
MMCQDVMKSGLKSVFPETTIEEAAILMRDAGVGFLPVCDHARRVLGTLTDRDITIRAVASRAAGTDPVERFMTRSVVACRLTDDLLHAQELMSAEKVSRIMCVDEDGALQGVISLSDIARLESGARAAAIVQDLSDREVRS